MDIERASRVPGADFGTTANHSLGGLPRPHFAVGFFGTIALMTALLMRLEAEQVNESARTLVQVLASLILTVLVAFRLKNIGINMSYALLIYVPVVNLFVFFRCLFYPPGWCQTRKMDRVGRVVVYSVLGFFGVVTLLVLALAFNLAKF